MQANGAVAHLFAPRFWQSGTSLPRARGPEDLQHPEADAALCQRLHTPGYLDVWRGEDLRNPRQ
jgi:hypothetical protein